MIRLIKSIGFALQGIKYLISTQRNARIHCLIMFIVITLGLWLKITRYEWLATIIIIAIVIAAEAFNTSIEKLCDVIDETQNPKIKIIKDLSAAAILILSIGAILFGFILFIPKLF